MMQIFVLSVIYFTITANGQPNGKGSPGGETSSTGCDIDGKSATYTETINGNIRNIVASGCPNHPSVCINKPNICDTGEDITEATVQDKNWSIPAYPCISDYPGDGYDVSCVLSDLGIMRNGVAVFSPTAGTDCDDAMAQESVSFDYCGGHAAPGGNYHYHAPPACLLYQLNDSSTIQVNGHSPQIGWAFDGFPVYGPHGLNGKYIKLCSENNSISTDCLDSCSGHMQHTIDGFKYHYHIASPVGDLKSTPLYPVPSSSRYPYTFGCYRGVLNDWSIIREGGGNTSAIECAENGTTSDYLPKALVGITEVYVAERTTGADGASTQFQNRWSDWNLLSLFVAVVVFQQI